VVRECSWALHSTVLFLIFILFLVVVFPLQCFVAHPSIRFREFYLEMTKCIQFPIAMSLPWMMTEYVIEQAHHLKELMFFPMDIYNDSADYALRYAIPP
jgi:hypothetical protein